MTNINELFSDKQLVKGKSYPLDYGEEGMWRGMLLEFGRKKSCEEIEQKLAAFLQANKDSAQLTDAIREKFVDDAGDDDYEPAEKVRRSMVLHSSSENEEDPMHDDDAARQAGLKEISKHSRAMCVQNSQNSTLDQENAKQDQQGNRNFPRDISNQDLSKTVDIKPPESVTIEMVFEKLKSLEAYMHGEFRRLRATRSIKSSHDSPLYTRPEFADEEHEDSKNKMFSLKMLKRTSPNSFVRDFALRKYGEDFLMHHVIEPGKKTQRTPAPADIVKTLQRVLFMVFMPTSEAARRTIWEEARRSLNQKYAESSFSERSEAKAQSQAQ